MASQELRPWSGFRGPGPFGRDPFSSFRREVERLFDDFLPVSSSGFAAPLLGDTWPSLDVRESERDYTITAELPGLEQKDIELSLRENGLTISGEKREERKEEKEGRVYSERSFGRFSRTIPFETEIDADRVEARFKNGVLTVSLPKSPRAQEKSRRIEVKG